MDSNKTEIYPGWRIVKQVGAGTFGTVFEIERNLFGKVEKAALKHITIPQNESDIENLYINGYDEEEVTNHFKDTLEDIVHEYSLMAELKGHPNIVYCDDIRYTQKDDGIGWDILIKMELLTPMTKELSNTATDQQVIKVGQDICNALVFCASKNIIHRDIKPQNIFLSESGDYKLGDFGEAKTIERTTGGTQAGTIGYMAPEVANFQPYGNAADVYSLGLVLYWMLNERRLPFLPLPPEKLKTSMNEIARNRRMSGEPIPVPAHGSEELKRIVLKACAFDPKDRYASAQEMLNALNNMSSVKPEPVPEPEDLDVHKEMTFEHTNHPAGKYLSIQVDAREVHFSVPMDIKDGQTIHLTGKGKYDSSTGIAGDLYITINIKPAPIKKVPTKKLAIGVAVAFVLIVCCFLFFSRGKQDDVQANTSEPDTSNMSATKNNHVHSWKDATCTLPQICATCGETSGSATGHQWIEATRSAPRTCRICAATEGEKLKVKPVYINNMEYCDKSGKLWTRSDSTVDYPAQYDTSAVDIWKQENIAAHTVGPVYDNQGNRYKYALYVDGKGSNSFYISYNLEGKYTNFTGWCGFPADPISKNTASAEKYFEIYADDELIWTTKLMDANGTPEYFDLDVTDVDILTIFYPSTKNLNEAASLYDGQLS